MNVRSSWPSRHDFLAEARLSTYSLLVLADGQAEAKPPERTPAEICESFRTIAPIEPETNAWRFEGEPRVTGA